MAGTEVIGAGNSVITVARYDFDGTLDTAISWPQVVLSSAVREAKVASFRTSSQEGYTVIAIGATVPRSGGGTDTVVISVIDTGTDLVVASATYPANDDQLAYIPVGIAITEDAQVIGVLVDDPGSGDSDYGLAFYAPDSMTPTCYNKKLGTANSEDHPAAITMADEYAYVTGTADGANGTEFLTGAFTLDNTTTPVWSTRFGISGRNNVARAIGSLSDGDYGQPVGPGAIVFIAGSTTDGDSDFLTVAYDALDGDYRWSGQFGASGLNEDPVSMAMFVPDEMEEVPPGYYVYVTGTAETESNGTNILTKLYRDNSTGMIDVWPAGASWGAGGTSDEAAAMVIVTSSDNSDPQYPERSTRALVTGWTNDRSNHQQFVTLKYNAVAQSSGNKTPMWERAEDALTGTYTNAAAGIAHRVIQDQGQDPKLNFFVTGPSNTGATLENWWSLRFRENWE